LDRLSGEKAAPAVKLETADAVIERADLLSGFGLRMRDARLLERAGENLSRLLDRLDADYEPLTWARAAELLGSAFVARGEIAGRVELIAEGVAVLAEAGAKVDRDHSPLDFARSRHALA